MISFMRKSIELLSLLITFFSCGSGNSKVTAKSLPIAGDTVSYEIIGVPHRGVIVIKDTIDLNNRRCTLPEGITLKFKGGVIKNGTLVGNKTKINCEEGIFNRVRILGTWIAPVIKTSCFTDLSYDNALKDVLALSDSSVNNKIYIEEGNYQVTAYKNGDVCISVSSNTQLIINGVIKLTPNNHRNYYIIQATGHKISVSGSGTIIGDKHTHTGKEGEWGMGIYVKDGHQIYISDLKIKDCWGDCIYVGSGSSDVRIEDCLLDHGRRQGISITSAEGVTIRNCTISNVQGTNPEYAIDVEPNKGETVNNVTIEKVRVKQCRGGFLAWGKAKDARIGNIVIKKCVISGVKKLPVSLVKCSSVKVVGCIIKDSNRKNPIHYEEIGSVFINRNRTEW